MAHPIERRHVRQGLRAARSTRRPQAALGALALAVAVGVLGTLAGCTGGGSTGDGNDDKSSQLSGDEDLASAPPGKYKTLPQPCIAVDLDTLKALVPGARTYDGTESLTYDTDRRVGCSWQAKGPDGADRSLVIDMERVVSYDPAVSDEVEAKTQYDQQVADAQIPPLPLPGATTSPPASTSTPTSTPTSATPGGTDGPGASTGPGDNSPGGTGDGGGSDTAGKDYGPRRLTDVGNAAFIYDTVKQPKSGARRDVTLVFRTANVLVTIHYGQAAPPAATAPPQPADLQEDTEKVAQQLEKKVEG